MSMTGADNLILIELLTSKCANDTVTSSNDKIIIVTF